MEDGYLNPNYLVLGTAALYSIGWGLASWVRDAAEVADPWDAEQSEAMESSEAVPLCHRCLAPHSEEEYFCAECGASIGSLNNLNPYLYVFSLGEALRYGTSGNIRITPSTITAYLAISLSQGILFVPFYWTALFMNVERIREENRGATGEETGADSS